MEAGTFWDPYGPHPMGGVGNALIKGCTALGIPVSIGGPVAILAGSHGDRPHCIYRRFCIHGCTVGAKASMLVTHVPDAAKWSGENPTDLSAVNPLVRFIEARNNWRKR